MKMSSRPQFTEADRVWDLVVVGGGTAGIVAAKSAATLGAATLLIERHRTGGDCLWTGCVPSKALIRVAAAAAQARDAQRFGVRVERVEVDFAAAMAHVRSAITHIAPVDSIEALEADGVHVVTGHGEFTGPDRMRVGDRVIAFRQAVLAMGAAPAAPPIPGLDGTAYLTSETIWDLEALPADLVVVGGGSVGCELGQAFARLGSRVTIIDRAPRILPLEDPAAADFVEAALRRDGVRVRTGHAAVRVEDAASAGGRVVLADGTIVAFGSLLVAVGRSPRTAGLGLDAAGVAVDQGGFVVTDKRLRTTNPRIWAAGDLTGHPQFTHTAGVHASRAASNAILGVRRAVDLTAVPRVTFTCPEVAAVGVPADPLPTGLRLVVWPHSLLDRAVTEGDTDGFTRLAIDRKGRVVGATIVGARAGEALAELTLAIRHGLRTRDLAGATHPYPTYGDGVWNAAIDDVRTRLTRPPVRQLVGALVSARRGRLDRPSDRPVREDGAP